MSDFKIIYVPLYGCLFVGPYYVPFTGRWLTKLLVLSGGVRVVKCQVSGRL